VLFLYIFRLSYEDNWYPAFTYDPQHPEPPLIADIIGNTIRTAIPATQRVISIGPIINRGSILFAYSECVYCITF